MVSIRLEADGRASSLSLCYILCFYATWIHVISALSPAERPGHESHERDSRDFAIIPSISVLQLSSSAPSSPPTLPSEPATSITPNLVPTQPSQSSQENLASTPVLTSSIPVPSSPESPPQFSSSSQTFISSAPFPSHEPPASTELDNNTTTSVATSTNQGLKPIPPAETQIGDPNGHHEITEPNFTATKSCAGCSGLIEVTATGWQEHPAEGQKGTTELPKHILTVGLPKATIPAGPSRVVISQESSGGNFVIGGSTTLTPGQTITIDDTPIAIQTTAGRTEVVVGTSVMALVPEYVQPQSAVQPPFLAAQPEMTPAPVLLPPILTLGTKAITADPQSQYVIDGQTLAPGGPAITVSETTLSLAPLATAVVINGETSSLDPMEGAVYTKVVPAALTFKDHVYTTNRAGWIVLSPSATLIPGGRPVTVDGTTLSLEHAGTAVVVQGSTMVLQPVTTIVTLTRGAGIGGGVGGGMAGQQTTGDGYAYSTGKPIPASASLRYGSTVAEGWLGGFLVLLWCGFGSFVLWL